MAAPGTQHMGMGALWFVGGVAITAISASAGGKTVLVTFGAILIGAGQFLYGLIIYLGRTRSPLDRMMPDANDNTKALARAMIWAAETEGPLDDAKFARVRSILKEVTGLEYGMEPIRDMSAAIRLDKVNTIDYLASVQVEFGPETKRMILRACTIVMTADGAWSKARHDLLTGMATALQTSPKDFDAAIDGILQPASA